MINNFYPHPNYPYPILFSFISACMFVVLQISFPGQNKDKQQQSAAIPGVAAPQTPPPTSLGSSPATVVPKRLLTKSKRALSEADLHQATSSEKPVSPSKTQGGGAQPTESEQNTQSPPPKSSIGMFHHLAHYMKLYEIIKGAYANNQVNFRLYIG